MTARRSVIPIFIPHLGCPHMCVFCNQHRISGETSRVTGVMAREIIEDGIKRLHGSEHEITVAFYGGSFTAIPVPEQEELLGAAKGFIDSGEISSIRLSTRPDCIDGEVLERLRLYGVKTVELGVQSMCPEVLAASGRGHTAEDAVNAANMIKAAGFELILQMMTGLPEDTPERSRYTAMELAKLRPDGVRIYPTVIVRDTALYDMWIAGEYREHTVEDAVTLCAELLDIFDEYNIPVIRLGLNPTEELSNGGAVGGAYHPALGELARSRRYLNAMDALITGNDRGKIVSFAVPKGKASLAAGQKRHNTLALCGKYGLRGVKIRECDTERLYRLETRQ